MREKTLKCFGVREADRRKVLVAKWSTDGDYGRPHQVALKIPHAELKDFIHSLMNLWESRAGEENIILMGWCQLQVKR